MSCPNCFQGHVHEGTPTGNVAKIHGRNTYVAAPPDGAQARGIIIIVPDAFGWKFVNNRLLADHYTSRGNFLVYLPEFMDGRSAPLWLMNPITRLTDNNSIWDWLWKPWYVAQVAYGAVPFIIHNRFGLTWPRIRSFFEAVRSAEGSALSIGAAGFCWGGKPVLTLTHPDMVTETGKPLVDAVFTGHPSALSIPGDVEKITKPVAIAIGDKDVVTPMSQVEIIRKTWENSSRDVPTEVVIYPGAGHGFCVRVDPKNENQLQQSREAEEQAMRWFRKYLE